MIDVQVVPRLVLFLPLPLLLGVAYQLRDNGLVQFNRYLMSFACVGAALMVLAETQNLFRLYPDKDEIHAELEDLRARYKLSSNDFVLTQYAVNPVANWFLGTPSGLITAFNRSDLNSYERLFVLNTAEGQDTERQSGERYEFVSERERFVVMRENIPLSASFEPVGAYEHLQFHELKELPDNWLFNVDGNWTGWVEP